MHDVFKAGNAAPAAPLAVGIAEAARMTDLSRRSIENYIAAKLLPSVRLGRRRLIRVRDLQKFLAADRPSPQS
jgi:excisionase family DNA binding protein